jgi:hypothetical protein
MEFVIQGLELENCPGNKTLGFGLLPVGVRHPGTGHDLLTYPVKLIEFILPHPNFPGNG